MRRRSRDDGGPPTELRRTLIPAVGDDLSSEAAESGPPTTEMPIAMPMSSPTSWPTRSTPVARLVDCSDCSARARHSRQRRPTGQQSAALPDGVPRFVQLARLQAFASHQHLGTPSCRLGRRNPRQTISSLSLPLSCSSRVRAPR